MATGTPSIGKYRETILFFLEHIPRETLGKLKLMKLLYFADFDHYERHKKFLLGETYLRWDNGPMPRTAKKVLEKMAAQRVITIEKKPMPAPYNDREIYRQLRPYDPKAFMPEEVETLHHVAEKWKHHTETEIKNATHGDPPWIATPKDAVIDYNLVFYRNTYGEMDGDDC
ncbi:MAG: Panacea domain-containing protein [Candidatus Peribacteraceae bacterium]